MARIAQAGFELGNFSEVTSYGSFKPGTAIPSIVDMAGWSNGNFYSKYGVRTDGGEFMYLDFPARGEVYARVRMNLYYPQGYYGFRLGFRDSAAPLSTQCYWVGGSYNGVHNNKNYFHPVWGTDWNTNIAKNLPGIYVGPADNGNKVLSLPTVENTRDWSKAHIVELHVIVDAVNGLLEVRIDGVTWATYTGNTDPMATGKVDRFFMDVETGIWDDIAINDTNGETNNTWPGNGTIKVFYPKADGTYSELEGSGFSAVDDAGDGSSNYTKTSGKKETYLLGTNNVLPPATGDSWKITCVRPMFRVKKDYQDSFVKVRPMLRIGSNDYYGSEKPVTVSSMWLPYDGVGASPSGVMDRNPVTGAAWSAEELANFELGVDFTLVESTTTA